MRTRQGAARRGAAVDRGSVTAETAVVLPALLVVLALLVWALACVAAQLACVDAARAAARLAARGEPAPAVAAAAREVAPGGAEVQLQRTGDTVRVRVRARVQPFGRAVRLPAVTVSAAAQALLEETLSAVPR